MRKCEHEISKANSTMVLSRKRHGGWFCGLCGHAVAGDERPLIKGGQGRSEDDVVSTAHALTLMMTFVIACALTAVIVWVIKL